MSHYIIEMDDTLKKHCLKWPSGHFENRKTKCSIGLRALSLDCTAHTCYIIDVYFILSEEMKRMGNTDWLT